MSAWTADDSTVSGPPKTTKATPERGLPDDAGQRRSVKRPRLPRTSATGSIRDRTPAGPGSGGTARSFPCRMPSSWSSFPRARGRSPPPPAGRAARLALQLLQRFGSFLKFLSAKNSCSPAVQMNGAPQSTQFRVLSWNSIATSLTHPFIPPPWRDAGTRRGRAGSAALRTQVRFAALFLARTLARERLLGAAAIARLQIEGMLLDILDDIFLLHLPLEAAKRAFDGLAILHFHFSQA